MIGMHARSLCSFVASVTLSLAVLGGCAGHAPRGDGELLEDGGASVLIESGSVSKEQVFDAAREVLMEYRFALDRVDATRGVITTHPKRTAGLASPWDREQSGLDQEWEDLLNEQRRVVRVEFDRDPSSGDGTFTRARVQVELLRTNRPGWRVETESVRLSNHARTRDRDGELEPASQREVIGLDARLAQRIADAITERVLSGADER
jgi:hypothetical protein